MPFLVEADNARSDALDVACRMMRYRSNRFLETEDNPGQDVEADFDHEVQAKLAKYYPVNLMVGQTSIRHESAANIPLHWGARGCTLSESDRMVREVCGRLMNLRLKPQWDKVWERLVDSALWYGHTLVKVRMNPALGPHRTAQATTDKFTAVPKIDANGNPVLGANGEPEIQTWRNPTLRRGGKKTPSLYQSVDANGVPLWQRAHTGLPEFVPLTVFDYLVDPNTIAGGIENCLFVADAVVTSVANVINQFGDTTQFPGVRDKLLKKQGWGKMLYASDAATAAAETVELPTEAEVADKCVLVDAYMKPAPNLGLPAGLHAVFALDGMIGSTAAEGVVLVWDIYPFDPSETNYIDGAREIYNSRDFFSGTYNTYTAPMNKLLNTMVSAAAQSAELGARMLLGVTGASTQAKIKMDEVGGSDGIYVTRVPDPQAKIANITHNPSTNLQREMARDAVGLMRDVSHQSGQVTEADFAAQVMQSMQQVETVVSGFKRRLVKVTERANEVALRMIQRHLKLSDLEVHLPDAGKETLIEFRKADLTAVMSVQGDTTTLFSGSPLARIQLLTLLVQHTGPKFFELFDMDTIQDFFGMERDLGESPRKKQVELAEVENGRLRATDAEPVAMVSPVDNDDVHIRTHEIPLGDANRHLMEPLYKTNLEMHIATHRESKEKKMIQLAMMAAMMAQATGQSMAPGQSFNPQALDPRVQNAVMAAQGAGKAAGQPAL